MSILFNVWMLPILFILHDFEEIIFYALVENTASSKVRNF